MLEVVGVTGVVHLGQIQSGLRSAMRIAQVSSLGRSLRVPLLDPLPSPTGWPHQDSSPHGHPGAGRRRAVGSESRRRGGAQVCAEGKFVILEPVLLHSLNLFRSCLVIDLHALLTLLLDINYYNSTSIPLTSNTNTLTFTTALTPR